LPRREQILVVDDDQTTCMLLVQHLTEAGYGVVVAERGKQALLRFVEMRPRIVIADWLMPGMDGLELCRRIREIESEVPVYFIMLTLQHEKEKMMEAFEQGVDDFLSKPFHKGELCARVRAGARILHVCDRLQLQNQTLQNTNGVLGQLNDKLRKAATTDDLTRLPNRREAMHQIKELWRKSCRISTPLSCAIMDIDHFKQVNDHFGHLRGDEVLQRAANAILNSLRNNDCVHRFGGEEFLVLFPEQEIEQAAIRAEKYRHNICSTVFADHAHKWPVSVSIGVAARTKDMTSWDELIRQADMAMYKAKEAGRNRVVTAA